jgi:hypothetical protein
MIARHIGFVAAFAAVLACTSEATARPVVRHGGGFHYRPHYGVGHYRPVVRPGYGWVRPHYRWRPGGAIAAGAAIGFLTAGAAAAIAASAPPAQGLCWYYTNPARTAGFWDRCP